MEKNEIKCCWNCKFSSFNTLQEKYVCSKFMQYLPKVEMPTPNNCTEWTKSKTTEV